MLSTLPRPAARRIVLAVEGLAGDPRPPGCRKLTDSDLYRIRVGQYRVVYEIRDRELLVLVVRVARRDEGTYRGI